jgi:hypothetical protein
MPPDIHTISPIVYFQLLNAVNMVRQSPKEMACELWVIIFIY